MKYPKNMKTQESLYIINQMNYVQNMGYLLNRYAYIFLCFCLLYYVHSLVTYTV